MKGILVIDNYDSFTYNLVQYVERLTNKSITVCRNDKIGISEISEFDKILISPGPGIPEEAGLCLEAIKKYAGKKSILGVCLGHQAIAEAFGGRLINYRKVYHGVAADTTVLIRDDKLFNGIPGRFKSGRYHAWGVMKEGLPDCFEITAIDEEENIMAMRHKNFDLKGVQFHPESVLTDFGEKIIENWLQEKT